MSISCLSRLYLSPIYLPYVSSCLSPLSLFLRQREEKHGAERHGSNMEQRNRGETWSRETTGEKHGAEKRQGRNMEQRDRGETWSRQIPEDSSPSCSSSQPQLVDNYFVTNSFFLKETEFAAKSNTPSCD